jgi:2-oxoglutarate ferredoxin oxidoreductase subunit beta
MKLISSPPVKTLGAEGFDFCPGCGYGSIVLAIAEAAADLPRPPVFIVDIGCVDFMITHLPGDVMMGPHGRASALASGYKRVHPDAVVCCIQGDGAFMGIGATETLHTALRGECITTIVLNNGVLADTGGQMAVTTVADQVTTTTPHGRSADFGTAIGPLEMVAPIAGVAFAERVAIDAVPGIRSISRAISSAFEVQRQGAGLSLVEVVSPCPTHWRMEAPEAWEHVRTITRTTYPTGRIVDRAQTSRSQ